MSELEREVRCAIYTRKSTEEGLAQEFNTLQAQREAAEAYILSQKQNGWHTLAQRYEDGGFSGASLERPALQQLLADIHARKVDCVVVYKVDRLSRSLLDFARLLSLFEKRGVSFVSVTQEFNTSTSMGRLTLHILLSFAQFEREIISERTRDKLSAARRKGKWTGGNPVLGYDIDPQGGRLVVNPAEAERVREIFTICAGCTTLQAAQRKADARGLVTKRWISKSGKHHGGGPWTQATLGALLGNILYIGEVSHKGVAYPAAGDCGTSVMGTSAAAETSSSERSAPWQGRRAALRSALLCAMRRTDAERIQLAPGPQAYVLHLPH
jgi:site-specific DNA recombinase